MLRPLKWLWRHLPVFLALVPLANWLGFLLFAVRRRSWRWAAVAALYLAAYVASVVLVNAANRTGPDRYEHRWAIATGSLLMLGTWLVGAIHAYRARDRRSGSDTAADAGEQTAVTDLRRLDSRRLGARLIDGLLIFGVAILLGRLAGGRAWGLTIFILWATVTYFFLCEATTGRTVGKALTGLRVVRRDGSAASANAVATRNVLRIFEEPLLALLVLVGSRKRRQRIGDFAAGTTVGRAALSQSPAPSWLRFGYPALWAVCGLAFALLVHPPHRQPPSGARIDGSRLFRQVCSAPDRWRGSRSRTRSSPRAGRGARREPVRGRQGAAPRRGSRPGAAPSCAGSRRSQRRARRRGG